MAQIGSYVPAASVKLSPLDAILTRMGGMFFTIRFCELMLIILQPPMILREDAQRSWWRCQKLVTSCIVQRIGVLSFLMNSVEAALRLTG